MCSCSNRARWAIGAPLALFLLTGATVKAQEASIHIDAGKTGPKLNSTQHGIFFEEINHAGDGGLYAELIRNRSFEDAATPEAWSAVGGARISLDTGQPLNSRNPHSLKLEIGQASGNPAGAANDGYWGIAVKRGASYRYSLWARAGAGFTGHLIVSLTDGSASPLCTAEIGQIGTEWKRHTGVLKAAGNASAAKLTILATQPGTVWLDVVSLFPTNTFHKRVNGLRDDLAEKLADLKPAFMRFPGGCYVEGDRLANRFPWKDTLGDIDARLQHTNLWGYRSSNGLGYHEYLQLCEDLKAEPLFVVNCGMAHEDVVARDHIGDFVQDALDAIEYANGPVTSTWGALRARNGHPAPFHLRLMEIGNENGWGGTLPMYEERYARFYDAIKAKYPQMRLVANVPVHHRPMDIVDDHYYNSPEWFLANCGRYDNYDRKGPKVYVGEYAVTQNCGTGNLRASLAEAAWMMGMERNADVVVMGSYAPLFVNVNDRKWNPDAIVYDSSRSYGTPSYYVQKLFSRNKPDAVLSTRTEAGAEIDLPKATGGIGLGSWLTRVEYKDVVVEQNGQTLYKSDFTNGAKEWHEHRGDWQTQDEVFLQNSSAEDVFSLAGDNSWGDYTLRVKARKIAGAEGFLILFHAKDNNNWIWWNIGGWGNTRNGIEKNADGGKSSLGGDVPGHIETGRWYDVRVEVKGAHIRCYLDGKLVQQAEDNGGLTLHALAGKVDRTGEIVLKVVNASSRAKDTEIEVAGVRGLASTGEAIVLTGDGPNAENSLDAPERIAPKTSTVIGIAPRFRHVFPPNSLTILRLKPQ